MYPEGNNFTKSQCKSFGLISWVNNGYAIPVDTAYFAFAVEIGAIENGMDEKYFLLRKSGVVFFCFVNEFYML